MQSIESQVRGVTMLAAALEIGDPESDAPPTGEGGQVGADGLCTLEPCGRSAVAIIGGTGYVGRLLARRLLSHPTLCLGPIVGSKRSEGMLYQDVWEEKESALMKNYGSQLWSAMPFPPQLAGVKVASLEALLASDCKIAVSCVAPDVGYIEDILVNGGVKVYSISPYKRSENLTVPEVNPAQIPVAADKALFKSPNCVSVGTTLALKALDDAFGLAKVSVCTFQSLSGRGDAMYPPELVQGNIYPVWNTKERTEVYIGNEICALVNLASSNLTVRAHRVGVHIGHFVDVRCKVRCPELLTSVDAVHRAFEAFAPLAELYGPEMPSLPKRPLKVIKEVGAPRPATHNMEFGGMQVAVGNVKLDDGIWDCCFSLVVNNMIRGQPPPRRHAHRLADMPTACRARPMLLFPSPPLPVRAPLAPHPPTLRVRARTVGTRAPSPPPFAPRPPHPVHSLLPPPSRAPSCLACVHGRGVRSRPAHGRVPHLLPAPPRRRRPHPRQAPAARPLPAALRRRQRALLSRVRSLERGRSAGGNAHRRLQLPSLGDRCRQGAR